jgi:membrane protein implicated in regulation of membrane protease activity
MAHDADANKSRKAWLWLLVLPWIAMIWVPSYNKVEPTLWDFPFFYWYQLLWVLISAVITALVYHKTKPRKGSGTTGGAR